jgi:macrolide transport system ATP-binding/permease protein
MRFIRASLSRFIGLFSRARRDRDFANELDSHLQMHIDDNVRSGMSPDLARRDALLKLGGLMPTQQIYHERSTVPALENFALDLRFTLRQLRKNPGFTGTAVLILALGVCASASIFAFVDSALIKPLPYQDPTRLVGVYESVGMIPRSNLSYPDYIDWKKSNQVFSSLDVWNGQSYLLRTNEGTELVTCTRVSDGFFRTLGVAPLLGRDFYEGEDLLAAPRTVLVSYQAWQTRFGARQDVLGESITLSDITYTIIGVLPREFQFALRGRTEFWTTLHPSGGCDLRRGCHGLYGVARLKDGVSIQAASAEMTSIAEELERQYPESNRGQGAAIVSLSEAIVGDIRPILLVLLSGAGLLMLISSVNVASLLLVRSQSRRREITVRRALGAGTARLITQFVTEGLVLVFIGGGLGLICASWTVKLLVRLIPARMLAGMPYLQDIGIDFRIVAFAALLSLCAAILFALIPALQLSTSDLRDGLSEASRGSAGTLWRRFGSNFVVVELAIAVILLVGAGLLTKSFYRLLHVDNGLEADHLAIVALALPGVSYGKDDQAVAFGKRLVSRIESLPGIEAVGLASRLALSGNGTTTWIRVEGRPFNGEHNEVNFRDVSAGYFGALKARLLRGNFFSENDDSTKPNVVVINRAFEKQYFSGEDPIGKKIGNTQLAPKSVREIVGVVEDIREGSLDEEIWPTIYIPFNQEPETYLSLVARTSQPESSMLTTLVAAIREIDPSIGTYGESTMNDRINDSPTAYLHRSSAWLVAGFALTAFLLGLIGLYGVVAYSVTQRTREIGIRMALGAEPTSVYSLILKEAGLLILIGTSIGLACSLPATGMMRHMLFGVSSWDLPTMAAAAVLLSTSALAASFIPARRAASLNPVVALRAE